MGRSVQESGPFARGERPPLPIPHSTPLARESRDRRHLAGPSGNAIIQALPLETCPLGPLRHPPGSHRRPPAGASASHLGPANGLLPCPEKAARSVPCRSARLGLGLKRHLAIHGMIYYLQFKSLLLIYSFSVTLSCSQTALFNFYLHLIIIHFSLAHCKLS